MEKVATNGSFKLDYKRTLLIGFAFFGILLLWQVYDSWCPTMLSELFARKLSPEYLTLRASTDPADIQRCNDIIESQQYLVGVMMAIDNLAALILLPIFGRLSDKTRTPIGKRMPYILVGTFVCAVAFPLIPVFFHNDMLGGVIAIMAVVVIFAMMYRNPAVALMPDITPKPLRSKANGLINIMGYIGGAFGTVLGIFFVLSDYLGTTIDKDFYKLTGLQFYVDPSHSGSSNHNFWVVEIPFIIASVLMLISALVLFFTVRENELAAKMKDEMERGEKEAEVVDAVTEDQPLSKANRIMLLLILGAEFFWFMADNGVATFMVNYTTYYMGAKSSSMMIATIVGGVGSVVGFAVGGIIASKIGRKWTLFSGLGLSLFAYALWIILMFIPALSPKGELPVWIYIVWLLKGFGMSLVHVNSYPMVVELCPNSRIGRYTGYYYAASMAAQTITPILVGLLLFVPHFSWELLPIYGATCLLIAGVIFFFVKNVKSTKTTFKKGLEAMDTDD